ncbi:MAG TPA: hypothetical protein VLV31_00965 [Candidatus Acidoferrales bacterium]|nr:hypothetical protein [Candidatus Acidoferrales bacterium]
MDLKQVRQEIETLGKSPAAEKVYPITSEWVPITDVLAVINRFEKHWRNYAASKKDALEAGVISKIIGES